MWTPQNIIGWALLLLLFSSCQEKQESSHALFQSLDAQTTGVNFVNAIKETEAINYFTYPYLYMGGGIAIGDVNNDGWPDLFFTSNMGENKLFLNQSQSAGKLHFADITTAAGVAGDERWDTGVTMADVNADGWLDIYVSVSGKWASTKNLLYLNNGDLTFTEQAEAWGIADEGHSTQATFLDYDRDGDLDLYVANYPPLHFKSPNFVYSQNARNPKMETSDHLYRNDGEHFTDVTATSGVLNFGLSLSASAADYNNDGWVDLYVSNDFAAPDQLYINNQDGTFSDKVESALAHSAYYGMGTDAADFNNDGLIDLFQVDMTPEDNFRSKANMAGMNPAGFREMVDLGLTHQYMENALQMNQGIGPDGLPRFGDVSRMTGTALTDWSWSPLFADLDNDGWKDLYVTNGTRRDINNKDYFNALNQDQELSNLEKSQNIPSERIDNYVFKNQDGFSFEKVGQSWGLSFKGYSNGSAYGDLDGDGDLDLVVNNIDDEASVFENQGSESNWLRVKLQGPSSNPFGIGARVEILADGNYQLAENQPTRGFQSASEPLLHFGMGQAAKAERVQVTWGDGKVQILQAVSSQQVLLLDYQDAQSAPAMATTSTTNFLPANQNIAFRHRENFTDDFAKERLLPHATSQFGPGIAVGDVNRDGLSDFYVGGAKDQAGALFIQKANGEFEKTVSPALESDRAYEDLDGLFFDADGDGWDDLYLVSGGNEAADGSDFYQDRLYKNEQGQLTKWEAALPRVNNSGSKVKACDFDADGDLDLLVAGRLRPQKYGLPAQSFLLLNEQVNGQTVFKEVTAERAPALQNLGMVTDFVWTDFDGSGSPDLVLVGEWMPVCFFKNEKGYFVDQTEERNASNSRAWWFSIAAEDLNQDGIDDLVLGNLGHNYKYQASADAPFELYLNDFDQNEQLDIVLGYYREGKQFPVRGLQCSAEQMPSIKEKYKTYNKFASAELSEIYTTRALAQSKVHFSVNSFTSQIWYSNSLGHYDQQDLPAVCQMSSINAVLIEDVNRDGHQDLILGGNLFSSEVETKRNDASIGQYLQADGKGQFKPVPYTQSGLMLPGDVKDLAVLSTFDKKLLIVANNNDDLQVFKF